MHEIYSQSISASETDNGKRVILITLRGQVDPLLSQMLRLELNKAHIQAHDEERRVDGVIIAFDRVKSVDNSALAQVYAFDRDLGNLRIPLLIVASHGTQLAFVEQGIGEGMTFVRTIKEAKVHLGILEEVEPS